MSEFIEILQAGALPIGRVTACTIAGRTVAVYHTERGFFATDNTCPHRGGPLAEGDLLGNEIVCPWHLWGFDVESGVCTGNPEISVATHEVQLDGDRVLLRVL